MRNPYFVSSILSLTLVAACAAEKKTEVTSSASTTQYNSLVGDYNGLVQKYNAQTARNVANDTVIKSASTSLARLDVGIKNYKESIESARTDIRVSSCLVAKTAVTGRVRDLMSEISMKANELSQGILEDALLRMSKDLSPYQEKSRVAVAADISIVQEQVHPGLSGLKSFVLLSYNDLIEEFNTKCASSPEVKFSEAAPARGDIVVSSASGESKMISEGDLKARYSGTYSTPAYAQFTELAASSGGFLGFSPTAEQFSQTVDAVLENILKRASSEIDVAIILDTTSSMDDDIGNVKSNMAKLLTKLKERTRGRDLRLSLVLYRDRSDEYVTKVAKDLTSDIDAINTAIQNVSVAGGGDEPEAVVDALETTLNDLSWRPNAGRSVVLISDAPGHATSAKGTSMEQIVGSYKRAGTGIIVYPILVNR